jgi:hypothetical protein
MKPLSSESPKWLRVPINVLTRVTYPAHLILLDLIIQVISDENINCKVADYTVSSRLDPSQFQAPLLLTST